MSNARTAAQQKIGYVNTDKILKKMPEYKGVQQQLNELSKQWRKKLAAMQQRIDTLKTAFNAKKLLYTDKVKARKQRNIQQLIKKHKQYLHQKFSPNGAYFKKQQQLLKPIQRRIYEAITTVANQNNIDFVFDRAQNPSLLFTRKQWNLNSDVLQQLNVR
jgi:outer membrane protein